MVTSVYTSTNAFELNESSLRARLPLASNELNDIRLRLTQVLQTTLELSGLLELFFNTLQKALPVRGMKYLNAHHHLNLSYGREALHHCDYRLLTSDDDLGEIIFCRSKRFSENEMAQLETLMSTLLYPLRNSLMYRQAIQSAMQDPLTGTGNRTAMDNALHRELHLSRRYQQELSLVVLDIDHFKQVNDTYGHSCGDAILKQIAGAIQTASRESDMLFRYGGEEFVLVLTSTDQSGALVIAERIREHIASLVFMYENHPLHITISAGVSTLTPQETIQSLFERADKALYQAKHLGRNRVEASLSCRLEAMTVRA